MSQADYDEASRKALSLFEYGQVISLCWLALIGMFSYGQDLIEKLSFMSWGCINLGINFVE
jgi:hypothetical protein